MRACLSCQRVVEPTAEGLCPVHCLALHDELHHLEPAEAVPGHTLGARYLIEAVLGRGGMGVVLRARHAALDRSFAIKVLHPELVAVESHRERFLREARTASGIRHPQVVDITDFGVSDHGLLFLVMELLGGCDLGDLVRTRGALHPTAVAHIGRQICRALEVIHAAGIVHRDLKPDNCRVLDADAADAALAVKVLDFGIAAAMDADDEDRLTRPGKVIGTPAYMSPEQVNGAPVDGRSDIYSLGCILYELATGAPFVEARGDADALVRHLLQPVRPPSTVDDAIPGWLDAAVTAALSKDPDERPQTAGALADMLAPGTKPEVVASAIRPTLESTPLPAFLPAPLAEPAEPATQPARRRRALGSAAAVALIGAGVAFATWPSASQAPVQPRLVHARAPSATPDPPARHSVSVSDAVAEVVVDVGAPAETAVAPDVAVASDLATAVDDGPSTADIGVVAADVVAAKRPPRTRNADRRKLPPVAAPVPKPVSPKQKWELVPDDR